MSKTDLVVVLDRSGSMATMRTDHEGGLNAFVADQKKMDGDVLFSLFQFNTDNPCEVIYDGVPIAEVGPIALTPSGGTPLLDAIGMAINKTKERLAKANRVPDLLVFTIITDGLENGSREMSRAAVQALIADQEKAGWKFMYLGANVDAFAEGRGVGVNTSAAVNYSQGTAGQLHKMQSDKVLRARGLHGAGMSRDEAYGAMSYSAEERQQLAPDKSADPTQP